jgi:cell division septum initiation protein DivIVA
MAQNKRAAALATAAQIKAHAKSISNDAMAQRNRILAALRTHGSLTTLEARRRLDVLHPAARVMELRDAGFLISTVWSVDHNELGSQHRVARYHLLSEPQAEAL